MKPCLNDLLALRSTRHAARAALALLSLAFLGCLPGPHGLRAAPGKGGRAVFVVHLPSVPGWQDFAFLATVPAATVRSDGEPAVIALGESGAITREMDDYLRRYKPQALYCLGPLPRQAASTRWQWHALDADSADTAASVLAHLLEVGRHGRRVPRGRVWHGPGGVGPGGAAPVAPVLLHGRERVGGDGGG